MIKIMRNPEGAWVSSDNRVYSGEDAKILDKLFGYDDARTINKLIEQENFVNE